MSFQELYSDLQQCERDKIFLLSGYTKSNDLQNHLRAINDTIFLSSDKKEETLQEYLLLFILYTKSRILLFYREDL